jgi:excisionase family DNA binding protein
MNHTPKGHVVLREKFTSSRLPEMSCSLQMPELIASVRDLVCALSSNAQTATIPETFSVSEAAVRLGCSSGQVRKLVQQGKLSHHWLGKNLRFRQKDLDDFWASQTIQRRDTRIGSHIKGGEGKQVPKQTGRGTGVDRASLKERMDKWE